MTSMDLNFRYATALDGTQVSALARVRDVYGIRKLRVDEAALAIAVEYDATRLDAARVEALLRSCGIHVLAEPVTV